MASMRRGVSGRAATSVIWKNLSIQLSKGMINGNSFYTSRLSLQKMLRLRKYLLQMAARPR
jgi:hypothetical protein